MGLRAQTLGPIFLSVAITLGAYLAPTESTAQNHRKRNTPSRRMNTNFFKKWNNSFFAKRDKVQMAEKHFNKLRVGLGGEIIFREAPESGQSHFRSSSEFDGLDGKYKGLRVKMYYTGIFGDIDKDIKKPRSKVQKTYGAVLLDTELGAGDISIKGGPGLVKFFPGQTTASIFASASLNEQREARFWAVEINPTLYHKNWAAGIDFMIPFSERDETRVDRSVVFSIGLRNDQTGEIRYLERAEDVVTYESTLDKAAYMNFFVSYKVNPQLEIRLQYDDLYNISWTETGEIYERPYTRGSEPVETTQTGAANGNAISLTVFLNPP